jgi:hypothetical protein
MVLKSNFMLFHPIYYDIDLSDRFGRWSNIFPETYLGRTRKSNLLQ